MAVSVFFAIKDAISHSRKEAGLNGWWKLGKNIAKHFYSIFRFNLIPRVKYPKIKKHITEQLALNDLQKNENLMPLFLVISGQKPVAIWLKVWLGLE